MIILFDVDGTLTESRKKIKNNMIQIIKELKKVNQIYQLVL